MEPGRRRAGGRGQPGVSEPGRAPSLACSASAARTFPPPRPGRCPRPPRSRQDVAPNGTSEFGSISADGRYVFFVTLATNIVPTLDQGRTATAPSWCAIAALTPAGDFTSAMPVACFNIYSARGSEPRRPRPAPSRAPPGCPPTATGSCGARPAPPTGRIPTTPTSRPSVQQVTNQWRRIKAGELLLKPPRRRPPGYPPP